MTSTTDNNKNQGEKKDHWSAETYAASASFVPKLATQILSWLDPQPTDRILDIGCGDGKFTANFIDKCAEVYGVDASGRFIEEARAAYGREGDAEGKGKVRFEVVDCTRLEEDAASVDGSWDKVISNAALHWILRPPQTRLATLSAIHRSLKPGGTFIFEQGGAGCVSEILSATIPILRSRGFTLSEARDAIPWFYADASWMRAALESVGFKVERVELVYRDTRLEEQRGKKGGVEGWVRLMLADVLDVVEGRCGGEERESVVREICEAVEWSCSREYEGAEGGQWLGYVRLRGIAVKN